MPDKTIDLNIKTEHSVPYSHMIEDEEAVDTSGCKSGSGPVSDMDIPVFTHEKLREWIIAAEILGKPKCKR